MSPKESHADQMQRSGLFGLGSMGSMIQSPGRPYPSLERARGPSESFKKFVPRFEKEKIKKQFLDEMKDFNYVPKKFMCKKHRETEVEFCCRINETFFCKLCLPTHAGHDDLVLAEICKEIQEDVIKLKHQYIAKKEFMINKLDSHQQKIENVFKIYYDTLDECRMQVLGQEYKLREHMDNFESQIAELLKDIRSLNFIEFYHEEHSLRGKIKEIKG